MGTDIHMLVEVKTGSRWIAMLAPIWPNDTANREQDSPLATTPDPGRHYGLFSVLADVRNRTGRGAKTMMRYRLVGEGANTEAIFDPNGDIEVEYDTDDGGHDPLEYISTPRGVPAGANKNWCDFTGQRWVHDATWLTLKEIQEGPWDQVQYQQAVVPEEEYLTWKETGAEPKMLARSAGGPGTRIVNEVEYEAGIRGEHSTTVTFRWKGKTVREDAPKAWWAIVAMMQIVAPDRDPERVRLLVAFDS